MRIVSFTRLDDLPIRHKLQLITLIVLPVVIVLTAFTVPTIGILSGLRAYVAGESLYSKYQKDAVFYLERFVRDGNERDLERYRESIRVPVADGRARRELESTRPDLDTARRHFLEGKNAPADVPWMIRLFQWFRHAPYMREAIATWATADRKIEAFVALADDVAARRRAGGISPAERETVLGRIEDLNHELIRLENHFTATVGDGFRWASGMLLVALLVIDGVILGAGLWMGNRIARGITHQVMELAGGATAIARGNRSARVEVVSGDELGSLARWFNEMAGDVERTEARLQRTLSILASTLESTVDGILVVDLDGRVTAFNGKLVEIWGVDASRIAKGTPIEGLLHLVDKLRDPDSALTRFRDILNDPDEESRDLLEFRDGRIVERVSKSQREDGRNVGRVFSFRDITQRLRAEEDLLRSNRELEQFAYVASHDLQEPLRTIASYVAMLKRRYAGSLDPEADEYIRFATEGAARMQILIHDLLEFSRVGSQGRPPEPTDPAVALARVVRHLESRIRETGAKVTHDPLPSVLVDAPQLEQLLQNLLTNALKFRGEEAPRVHVTGVANGRECHFRVRDNGIGIAPQFHERIFVVFQRLHPMGTYDGTGIGLALCRKIVERHGGRIWVESAEQAGATFHFTLPPAPE